MINNRLLRHTAGKSARGGFTLVELLVVIAIIALLAAVAIGPITSGLKKAKDNAGMQTTHSLYIADFQYSIDNSSFADGSDSGIIAQALMKGGYISDPKIFFVQGGKTVQYTGNDAPHAIAAQNIAWDFMGNGTAAAGGNAATATGIGTSDPDQLPLIWATDNTFGINGGATATVNANGQSPFGNDGIPVVYKGGNSLFQTPKDVTTATKTIDNFIDASFVLPTGATYVVRTGSGS